MEDKEIEQPIDDIANMVEDATNDIKEKIKKIEGLPKSQKKDKLINILENKLILAKESSGLFGEFIEIMNKMQERQKKMKELDDSYENTLLE